MATALANTLVDFDRGNHGFLRRLAPAPSERPAPLTLSRWSLEAGMRLFRFRKQLFSFFGRAERPTGIVNIHRCDSFVHSHDMIPSLAKDRSHSEGEHVGGRLQKRTKADHPERIIAHFKGFVAVLVGLAKNVGGIKVGDFVFGNLVEGAVGAVEDQFPVAVPAVHDASRKVIVTRFPFNLRVKVVGCKGECRFPFGVAAGVPLDEFLNCHFISLFALSSACIARLKVAASYFPDLIRNARRIAAGLKAGLAHRGINLRLRGAWAGSFCRLASLHFVPRFAGILSRPRAVGAFAMRASAVAEIVLSGCCVFHVQILQ